MSMSNTQKTINKHITFAQDIVECIETYIQNKDKLKEYLKEHSDGRVEGTDKLHKDKNTSISFIIHKDISSKSFSICDTEFQSMYIDFYTQDITRFKDGFVYHDFQNNNDITAKFEYIKISDITEEWYFQQSLVKSNKELKSLIVMSYLNENCKYCITFDTAKLKRIKKLFQEVL